VLLGSNILAKAEELIQRGADKVYVVDSLVLKHYIAENYTKAISGLIGKT